MLVCKHVSQNLIAKVFASRVNQKILSESLESLIGVSTKIFEKKNFTSEMRNENSMSTEFCRAQLFTFPFPQWFNLVLVAAINRIATV